mmetsp:Transcript_7454/g.31762  ORF Transcript_7454/g.31762 Transcript_7454/m.31762 type:complete len:209 (-) Transcript_7454:141-767(-)
MRRGSGASRVRRGHGRRASAGAGARRGVRGGAVLRRQAQGRRAEEHLGDEEGRSRSNRNAERVRGRRGRRNFRRRRRRSFGASREVSRADNRDPPAFVLDARAHPASRVPGPRRGGGLERAPGRGPFVELGAIKGARAVPARRQSGGGARPRRRGGGSWLRRSCYEDGPRRRRFEERPDRGLPKGRGPLAGVRRRAGSVFPVMKHHPW